MVYLPMVTNGGNPPPTSIQLIEQALAAGKLDANTAVDPYLMRPDNQSSAYFKVQQEQQILQQAGSQPGAEQVVSATRPPGTIQWTSMLTKTGVKIHYRQDINGDDVRATGVGAAIDAKIYNSLNILMGRVWLDDTGCTTEEGVENGGSGALDIYLMHGMTDRGLEVGCNAPPTPGWVILNADRPIGDDTHIGMVQTAAHEMFHAIQDSYTYLQEAGTYLWMQEATAKWVEDYVYPNAQSEQDYAHLYLDNTDDPLDVITDGKRYYGEYLWPFYLYRVKGYNPSFIRTMFENAKSYPSTDIFTLQNGQDTQVSLFPDFAVKNLNLAPYNNYQTVDSLTKHVQVQDQTFISGLVKKEPLLMTGAYPGKFEHLSAWYFDYVFKDDMARTVVFYNGLTSKLTKGTGVVTLNDQGEFYKTDPLTYSQTLGMNVQALIKINDVWKLEDWSYLSPVVYCRDRAAQNIQELVVIITNSNYKESQANYDFRPVENSPTLLVSPTGCYQWKGTFDVADTSDPAVTYTLTGNAIFQASDSLFGPSVLYSLVSGHAQLQISGTDPDDGFTFTANGSVTLGPSDGNNELITYNMVTGGPHPNAYYGFGTSNQTVSGTIGCYCGEDGAWQVTPNDFLVGTWFLAPDPLTNKMMSQSQGNVIEGSYTNSQQITYHWHFVEQADP